VKYRYRIVTYPEAELIRFPDDWNGTAWELVAAFPLVKEDKTVATRCFFIRRVVEEEDAG
jgi:hypothetical protein